jgi:hypothetical protein
LRVVFEIFNSLKVGEKGDRGEGVGICCHQSGTGHLKYSTCIQRPLHRVSTWGIALYNKGDRDIRSSPDQRRKDVLTIRSYLLENEDLPQDTCTQHNTTHRYQHQKQNYINQHIWTPTSILT